MCAQKARALAAKVRDPVFESRLRESYRVNFSRDFQIGYPFLGLKGEKLIRLDTN